MNYLAHAYLSFDNAEILVGNMISDYVKGKKKFDYPPTIQKGIALHRLIDSFTDVHAATKAATSVFKPVIGAYAGAFVDVVYDHFLAKDALAFKERSLEDFATQCYTFLQSYATITPERFQRILPHMVSQNWLVNYRNMSGIESSFGGIFRRAKYLEYTDEAFAVFVKHYNYLQHCYNNFFPDVKAIAFEEYKSLTAV